MATTSVDRSVEVAARLRLAVTRTARRLRQEAGVDLTPSLAAALGTIDVHGPLTPSELAERERVQRPTATRLISRLAESGLVDRTSDPSDGRVSLVSVTTEGRALMRRLRTRKTAFLAKRLRDLEPEEVATLDRAAGILERLLERDGA
jgi:DNA-binding MarR family transcriptional regulator